MLQQGGHFAQLIAQFQSEAEEQEKERAQAEAEVVTDADRSNENGSAGPGLSTDSNSADAVSTATGAAQSVPKVSFAGGQSAEPQSQFTIEEARDRAASESNRRHSSAANAKPVIPKPSADKAKLMTEEESASGACASSNNVLNCTCISI